MSHIKTLPAIVRSRIAAGEVVENPASVVKELVENSLDAGARHVDVELLEGGKKRIRVADDGSGIYPDDMLLSVEHYATSKIEDAEDIFGVRTYGFRGEALASIAAVSLLTILSRRRELLEGTELRVLENGKQRSRPAACAAGTVVTVDNLFYQFPARRKFLKANRSETAKVSEILARLAIVNPGTAFTLKSDGRVLMDLPESSAEQRVRGLLGNNVADAMVPFSVEYPGILRAEGFLGLPLLTRPNRTGIYVSVGGRPVWDTNLLHTVVLGYEGMLSDRRFPMAVVDLVFAAFQVDVNVHPQKREVRLSRADTVRNFLRRQINAVLTNREGGEPGEEAPSRTPETERKPDEPPADPQELPFSAPASVERFDLWHGAARIDVPGASAKPPVESSTKSSTDAAPGPLAGPPQEPPAEAAGPRTGPVQTSPGREEGPASHSGGEAPPRSLTERAGPAETGDTPPADETTAGREKTRQVIYHGQMEKGYLIFELGGLLRIVDPHALHERILYNGLLRRKGPEWTRRLLFPSIVSLSQTESALKEPLLDALNQLGFDAREMGRLEIGVDSVPSPVFGLNIELVVRDVLAGMMDEGKPDAGLSKRLRKKLLETVSCRAAVKLGKRFSADEALALFREAVRERDVQTCPHGRPTSVDINVADIEKKLSRR